ncbi:MAG TPA: sulfate ABC transporter substrate-binding protein [Steroidobacteraceae bacterium]|jgi:sulfate transport system substrate-binding protein|nr:sulfate ABC transporter substrate-binding protein [Steroidobacteraceae bacterium]
MQLIHKKLPRAAALVVAAVIVAGVAGCSRQAASGVKLLNASYSPTRELYGDYNAAFEKYWKAKTGQTVHVSMSYGGSELQARSVAEGLGADVVTLALAPDIDVIAQQGKLLPLNWQTRLPNDSSPYTSTIVFLVRKGNPRDIHDWSDLIKPGVSVITPNPKTSGGARWNFLAAWAWALKQPAGSEAGARQYLHDLFRHVPVLDTSARAATTTFVQHGLGDVLIGWENEAMLAIREKPNDGLAIIYPSISVLAEPPVAVVDQYALQHGQRPLATAYLQYLYSKEGQQIIARNFYRPRDQEVAAQFARQYPKIDLVNITDLGGWASAQRKFFADGGVFDQIYSHGQ